MTREIKFRGKRKDNNEWVYGDLCDYFRGSGKCIMPDSYFATRDFGEEDEKGNPVIENDMAIGGFIPVIPETVGQYTGLNDKNGKGIYEGDFINIFFDNGVSFGNGVVKFLHGCFYINDMTISNIYFENLTTEIIGNIYETPNLI